MAEEKIWFPSLQEYNPNISKDKWLEILDNRNLTTEQNLHILACLYNFGGEATCTQLAQKYGETKNTYNSGSSNYAKNLVKAKICNEPPFRDNGDTRWWPVLYVGHNADKDIPGSYVWKLRDELKEACKEYNIEKWLNVPTTTLVEKKSISKKIWKLSHGKDFSEEDVQYYLDESTVCVHKNTAAKGVSSLPQGKAFTDEARTGDLFYLCRGNQEIILIGEFISNEIEIDNDGWAYRKYKKLYSSIKKGSYTGPNKWWTPNNNSTFIEIKKSEYSDFENLILIPFFGINLQALNLVTGDNLMNDNIEKYKELLTENKNIILHGAPGTGKTYLAKQIANAMNNSNLNLTVQGFESFISLPGYLDKHENSKDKETGTIQRYEKIAAKLLEKYHSFEYIADNADTLREEMQSERDEAGKAGWDNNQIVVNHIKKYVEFAKKENGSVLNDTIGFCQFHPSYDYTDFVEGLRPTKNNGFERKDGTFKTFCKKALQNLIDSEKTAEERTQEKSIEEQISSFITDSVDNEIEYELLGRKTKFTITNYDDKKIYISAANKIAKEIEVKISDLVTVFSSKTTFTQASEIAKFLNHPNYGYQSDSYVFALYKQLISVISDKKTDSKESKVEKKNYIFIIDEINRGELSKIFGELFFSIDPGYRGEEGRVNTQYQNLIEDDLFKDGFYIPENVYLIGTMNDIDRSVESMDFAMRRRFIFEEVTAAESADNMQLSPDIKDRMKRINDQISKTEGLNSAYHIGAAYFRGVSDFEKLWNLKLSSLVKEYLRGMDDDDSKYKKIKNAYFNESETIVTNEEESSASIEEQ